MQTVILSPLVRRKLSELFAVLLAEGYFDDPANAAAYCEDIRAFIRVLPTHKQRRIKNKRWGQYFASYKANRRTTWYITFDKEDNQDGELFYLRNIFNNHLKGYTYFIAGKK